MSKAILHMDTWSILEEVAAKNVALRLGGLFGAD